MMEKVIGLIDVNNTGAMYQGQHYQRCESMTSLLIRTDNDCDCLMLLMDSGQHRLALAIHRDQAQDVIESLQQLLDGPVEGPKR